MSRLQAKFIVSAYQHPVLRYLIIGGSTFCLDLGILVVLKAGLGVNVFVAATFSYWLSLAYNFALNRIWSFKASGSDLGSHLLSYSFLTVFNYLFSLLLIAALAPLGVSYTVAKAISVILSMGWNYLAYKHLIFRKRVQPV